MTTSRSNLTEGDIQNLIRLEATRQGVTLFRNNVGALQDKAGRVVRYGLFKGSSDLIGWTPITITPEHVGRVMAVFTAIEVKKPGGRIRPDQVQFIEQVLKAGGIAGRADSVKDFVEIVGGHTR